MEGVVIVLVRFPNLEVLNQHDRSGNKLEDIGDEEEDVDVW